MVQSMIRRVVIVPNRSYLRRFHGIPGLYGSDLFLVLNNLRPLRGVPTQNIESILVLDIPDVQEIMPSIHRFNRATIRFLHRGRPIRPQGVHIVGA